MDTNLLLNYEVASSPFLLELQTLMYEFLRLRKFLYPYRYSSYNGLLDHGAKIASCLKSLVHNI